MMCSGHLYGAIKHKATFQYRILNKIHMNKLHIALIKPLYLSCIPWDTIDSTDIDMRLEKWDDLFKRY